MRGGTCCPGRGEPGGTSSQSPRSAAPLPASWWGLPAGSLSWVARRLPAARACRPRHTPARTLLTARTCPAAQKALAAAKRPGLPAAPAALLVCLPATAPDPLPPSLSLCLFFFSSPSFFSPLSQFHRLQKARERGEKEGMPAVNGRQEGTGEGLGVSLLRLSGKRWVLIPDRHNPF